MYSRILATVNEHLNSELSARYAIELARTTGAKLTLCFVAQRDQPSSSAARAEEAMKRLFMEAEQMDVRIETVSETGDPMRTIGDIVRNEGYDLVCTSTRREDVKRRLYAGTVARRLLISLPCSVALVRVVRTGRAHPKEILVPLKARISHVEERAHFTAKIAQAFESRVSLFHCPQPVTKFFHGELHLTPLEWEKKLPGDIAHFMEHLRRYKIDVSGRAVPAGTGRAITSEAFSKRHDLIIMGASERSLFSALFRGNPVEEVLRQTPCDMIIFKPRFPAHPA